jgi:hypothetical protein
MCGFMQKSKLNFRAMINMLGNVKKYKLYENAE